MASSLSKDRSKKRKLAEPQPDGALISDPHTARTTKSKPSNNSISKISLQTPHQDVIISLSQKYSVLPASVISSTKIRNRITSIITSLNSSAETKNNAISIALLYARTSEVCKLITIVEQVKRVLLQEGKSWFQYNQLFEQPEREPEKDVVEETIVDRHKNDKAGENDEDDDDDDHADDAFEPVRSRFEEAMLPPAPSKPTKSLRIFISAHRIAELEEMENITVQSSEQKGS